MRDLYIKPNADTTLQINGVTEGTHVAGSTIDIQLTDGTNPVNPDSVTKVGDNYEVVVPPAVSRSTATLMKTGQTTLYATNDDGDIQSGRDVDFFTLAEIPLHNDGSPTLNTTTNRFTDTLGGQDYANNIVLDWSTWNGSTLISYYRNDIGEKEWLTHLVDISSASYGGFSDWLMTNRKELFNIVLHEGGISNIPLNYSPFNISLSTVYFTSSTPKTSTGNAFNFLNTGAATFADTSKTSSRRAIACRYMNLSISNILS